MNTQDKAKEYAEQVSANLIKDALEKAYTAGYEAGYTKGYEDGKAENPADTSSLEFVDLGLPSGTLWAKDFLRDNDGNIKYLTYDEASKYDIPTLEQCKELINTCRLSGIPVYNKGRHYLSAAILLGPNGMDLRLDVTGFIEFNNIKKRNTEVLFMMKDIADDNNEVNVAHLNMAKYLEYDKNIIKCFKGFKFPVLIVHKK